MAGDVLGSFFVLGVDPLLVVCLLIAVYQLRSLQLNVHSILHPMFHGYRTVIIRQSQHHHCEWSEKIVFHQPSLLTLDLNIFALSMSTGFVVMALEHMPVNNQSGISFHLYNRSLKRSIFPPALTGELGIPIWKAVLHGRYFDILPSKVSTRIYPRV